MQRRRQLMAMQTGGLPREYRRVEYIESVGGQRIDTIVTGPAEWHITAKSEAASGSRILIGRYYNAGHYAGTFNTLWTLGGGVNSAVPATNWQDIVVSFPDDKSVNLTIGEETLTRAGSPTNRTYTLFGNDVYNSMAKVKRCVCYQNGAIVANFVPCVRKSDSKPGMYDTVSKTFYTNAGTGEFIIPA